MFGRSTWVAFLSPVDRAHQRRRAIDGLASQHQSGALRDMGIALLAGRDFTAADTLATPFVAIISEAAAAGLARAGSDRPPVATSTAVNTPVTTIVGVAADARHRGRFRFSQGGRLGAQLDIYLPTPSGLMPRDARHSHQRSTGYAHQCGSRGDRRRRSVDTDYDVASLERRMTRGAARLHGVVDQPVWRARDSPAGTGGMACRGRCRRATARIGIRSALGANPRRLVPA